MRNYRKIHRYRKVHRYKRKKSIFRRRFFWFGVLILFIVGALFHFLFLSEFFQVEKIIVTGEEKVSAGDLKLLVEGKLENKILFFETKSIFLIDTGDTREDILSNFPQIAEVKVSRVFFDAVNILIIERLAAAVWCENQNCFLLDNEGVIFEEAGQKTGLIKIVDGRAADSFVPGEKAIAKETISQILGIESKLRESLKILIAHAFIASDERVNMTTSDGWDIYFNLKGDLGEQITNLGLVLEKEIPPECSLAKKRGELEYIDLRFGNRVYCK